MTLNKRNRVYFLYDLQYSIIKPTESTPDMKVTSSNADKCVYLVAHTTNIHISARGSSVPSKHDLV